MKKGFFLKHLYFCIYRNYCNTKQTFVTYKNKLHVFYDATCPICNQEMTRLHKLDQHQRLNMVDMSTNDFDAQDWGVNLEDLDKALHVLTPTGEWLVGLQAIRVVYAQVGLRWLVLPTTCPGIANLLDATYLKFAPHRQAVSRWLGLNSEQTPCNDEMCDLKTPNPL